MAQYSSSVKSLINGLSDFWLLYFKEIDQLEELYRGTEILIGQSYLNMLSLLLNNSLQDTTIFNKEFFKLLRIKESDLQFKAGTVAEANRYNYVLPDNAVSMHNLNNKILSPTESLDLGVDYIINKEDRALEFSFDPTNAYFERIFGTDNSQFRLRSRIASGPLIHVHLLDNGTTPVSVTRSDFTVTISYDGPANTGTGTTSNIVQAINLSTGTNTLLLAEITGTGIGDGSPIGGVAAVPLLKTAANPLDGFAVRTIESAFSAELKVNTITDWVAEGVEKGDTLRLIGGPTLGVPQEISVDLVRKDALYLTSDKALTFTTGDKVNFAVLRNSADPTSIREPFANSGVIIQSGTDGTITAATREFTSPTAVFVDVHEGDVIEFVGPSNVGTAFILDVVDTFTVVLSAHGLVDESAVFWNLHSVVDPVSTQSDGVLVNNLDGTATFTSALAAFTGAAVGTVLKIFRGSTLELFDITGVLSATSITVSAGSSVVGGTALSWGWARFRTPTQQLIFSPPVGWPKAEGVTVAARRLVDNAIVLEGTDFRVSEDTGRVEPLTVWRTSTTNTITYTYKLAVVENVTPLQSGTDGVITAGSTNTFTAPTAAFTDDHVGYAIQVTNSGLIGATNNGVHFIASVTSATVVELTSDKTVPTSVDPSNGILGWALLRRGTVNTDNVTAFQQELAVWAPDALVDRFHLYNTFGYLINKFERSSEDYRSLIRGIFQLFMLGPTLERFESAVNTVAGLPVIRDAGEILIGYSNGALQSGSDGIFDFNTKTFTSASANFTITHLSDFIFSVDGVNAGQVFKITRIVDSNTVELDTAPVTTVTSNWELTATAEQTVTTSRKDYVFSREIPIRASIKDTGNFGVTIFKAFEVLTDVFMVTDYIETPQWWDSVQIPNVLMPKQTADRRQSTPQLFENVIGPADLGRIGDPGFILGADSEGFSATSVVVRDDAGALDGVLIPDGLYPFSNDMRFTSATAAFTSADLGGILDAYVGSVATPYRILEIVSATEVKLENFLPTASASGLKWAIRTNALATRHKAAFVILNKFLKYHLFSVDFDATLLNRLSANFLSDLQELVFVAKPTYTYLILTPSTFFQETMKANETFTVNPELHLGGSAGSLVTGNAAPLQVIGSSWRIGSWFRYLSSTSTFSAPATSIPTPLGTPDSGFEHYLNKLVVTPTDFTSSSTPIQVEGPVSVSSSKSGTALSLSVDGNGEVTATFPTGTLVDNDIMSVLKITGSGVGNDGEYTIGSITDAQTATIRFAGAVSESGVPWAIVSAGTVVGRTYKTSSGQSRFKDMSGLHTFTSSHIGDYIRRPFVSSATNQAFRVDELVDANTVIIAKRRRVEPLSSDPDIVGAITTGEVLTVTFGDTIFSKSLASLDRSRVDTTTVDTNRYFIVFTTGANLGIKSEIKEYLAANSVKLSGALTNDATAGFYVEVVEAYDVVDETSNWEHLDEQIAISGQIADISNTPVQDINATVAYTAYGVREPIDPATAVFAVASGDTLYSIGMPDPKQARGKARTGKDMDLREEPIQITRT